MYRTERCLAFLARSSLSQPLFDTVPPRILSRRFNTNFQPFARCARTFGTSRRWRNEAPAEPAPARAVHLQNSHRSIAEPTKSVTVPSRPQLPQSCPGCGALTQESEPESAGYYSRSRRVIRQYLRKQRNLRRHDESDVPEDITYDNTETSSELGDLGSEPTDTYANEDFATDIPLCDRCHHLIHDHRGQSIAHPSIDDIADSIAESPFKRNHIYHVVDAADFPMSLIPDIFSKLTLAKPRSQNRRSQHDFSTKPTLSFIITRSDLLGSTKEVVDSMMTYFKSVLRQSLGRAGKDMRLGNIHLVSAKRGWWTKDIKEEIWKRGGANWMVGKVNVGKSNLFEVLFPKGSGERAPVYAELRKDQTGKSATHEDLLLEEDRLLPPVQPEVPFPVLPIVSSLPGTTASPVRLPFGGHKGELIDLPGLARGDLESYVKQDKRLDLVMDHRPNLEQYILKPGQSLVLGGGLIRITPQLDVKDPSTTVLACPFVPLKAHVTSTTKAITLQQQQRESGVDSILADNVGSCMRSAGAFDLTTDVTKSRAGPLVRSGIPTSKLPFLVYATDILIEGVGWVELVCQVRKSRAASRTVLQSDQDDLINSPLMTDRDVPHNDPAFAPFAQQALSEKHGTFSFPRVEVFSPNGRHVSQRPCLGAWTLWKNGRIQSNAPKLRRQRVSALQQQVAAA